MLEILIKLFFFLTAGWAVSLLTAFFIIKLAKQGERQRRKAVFLNSGQKRRGEAWVYWLLFGLFVILAGAVLALELYYFKRVS